MDVQMETGDRFDDAMIAAVNAHRDEVHQLRLALTVLVAVPKAQADGIYEGDDPDFKFKQDEAVRIAKLYADESLIGHQSVEDVIAVLQEGLA